MPFNNNQIDKMFDYVPPREDQIPKYEAIRAAAKEFAMVVVANTPSSADQTAALRLLRQVVYTANGSVALDGEF